MSSQAATPSAASAGYALIAPTTAIAAAVHILAVRSGDVHRLRSRLQVAASRADASSGQLMRREQRGRAEREQRGGREGEQRESVCVCERERERAERERAESRDSRESA